MRGASPLSDGTPDGAPGGVSAGVVDRVRVELAGRPSSGEGGQVRAVDVRDALARLGVVAGGRDLPALIASVMAEVSGAGPLQGLLSDPSVTDVLVNGPGPVWVDRGGGVEASSVEVGDEQVLRALAVRLASLGGRRLDDASPCVDARLPDGTRLHAVIPPIASGGTHLSLRVPRRQAFSLAQLVAVGTVPPGWAPVLAALVDRRRSFLISGGTGVGKTTVLAALLGRCDPRERLILVEDSGELLPDHPHVVRLEARAANAEGSGGVALDHLVRQALRMRPDRLVVGECRGAEVRDLLAALNTGHEGGCGTVHANGPGDVPARLEALGAVAGLGRAAIHAQIASALDVVVHLARRDGRRQVVEVGVLRRGADGLVEVVPALVHDDSHDRNHADTVGGQEPGGQVTGAQVTGRRGIGWPRLQAMLGLADGDVGTVPTTSAGGGSP